MSIGDQIEAWLATLWGQALIIIIFAIVFMIFANFDTEIAILIAMVVSWGLGAAYGRRQVYRKVGRAK